MQSGLDAPPDGRMVRGVSPGLAHLRRASPVPDIEVAEDEREDLRVQAGHVGAVGYVADVARETRLFKWGVFGVGREVGLVVARERGQGRALEGLGGPRLRRRVVLARGRGHRQVRTVQLVAVTRAVDQRGAAGRRQRRQFR